MKKSRNPGAGDLFLQRLCNKVQSKARIILSGLSGLYYGKFIGINISKIASIEEMIFSSETFVMPDMKDVFGETHTHFHAYEVKIQPFYVRSFKNAYCITNREEVFSSEKEVILEYTSQKTNPLIGESKKILNNRNIIKIGGSVAHLSLSGLEDNYYHFLEECLGRLYLIEKSKFRPDFYIISNHISFQSEWLNELGVNQDRIIPTNTNAIIQAKQLIIADFINNWELLDFRGHRHYQKQWIPSWIGEIYREKIIPKVEISEKKRVYISRIQALGRKIENEKEVKEYLTSLDFGIYNLETMSVKEQIELFANTSIIVAVHGAGLGNIKLVPKTAIIFELFPEYYHDSSYRIQAKALGLKYYYMIGKSRIDDNDQPFKDNLFVEIKLLKKALDEIIDNGKI